MKVLITGVNGFLGRELSRFLEGRDGIELYGLARTKGDLPVRYLEADILDKDRICDIFREHGFDVVVHFAAVTAHDQIVGNKFETLAVNLDGTQNLLQAFNKSCKNALFVYASTGKVYGDTNESPVSEKAVTRPMNILGKSKYITERVVDFYARPDNKYLVTRIFNIYGGSQKDNFVVPTIIHQLGQGNTLKLGNLTDQRDYLYIKDFLDAFWGCIEHKDDLGPFEIINIGSGTAVSVGEMIGILENCLGRKITVQTDKGKLRNDEKPQECCDNTYLKQLTGWQAGYSMEHALREVCVEKGLIK